MKIISVIGGTLTGLINSLLGAGGGMVAVPLLKKQVNPRCAHATFVCVILPLSAISCISYLKAGKVTVADAMPYVLWGVLGAVIGTYALQKLKLNSIRKIFALIMLWAGIRMVFR